MHQPMMQFDFRACHSGATQLATVESGRQARMSPTTDRQRGTETAVPTGAAANVAAGPVAGTTAVGAAADTSCSDIAEIVEAAATVHTIGMKRLAQRRARAVVRHGRRDLMRPRWQRWQWCWH